MSARVLQSPIQYRGTSTNGSYYFCIEGLPKRFTWQDLKDLVRKEAAHGIWTEMAYFSNGQTGETGWARVQRQEEARRLYTFLANNSVQGRRLRIHLFDTSASQPELIAHTCGAAPCILNARSGERSRQTAIPTSTRPVAYQPYYTPPPTAYAVQPPSPYDYSPGPTMYSSVAPPPNSEYNMQALQASMADMRMDTAVAAARSRMAQMYAQGYAAQQPLVQSRTQNQTQGPIYVESPIGTRVNVGRGSVKTEIRGIFVSNIDYKAGSRDLEKYFKQAGEIVNFQLQKDPVTGKSKGNATVQYAAADHAKKAVRLFDRETYMGLRLKVRLDKEPIAVGVPSTTTSRSNGATSANRSSQQDRNSTEPIIVNGSIRYD